jgi:hypothetical protein
MAVINSTFVDTDRFSWLPGERLFVAEASDLPALTRVWDDACDEGLTLVSHRTGQNVPVVIASEERDREGDVRYWDLVPIDPNKRDLFKVRIFND